MSLQRTDATVHADGSVTGREQPTLELTDTIGGHSSGASASSDQIGIGGVVGIGLVGGGEIGTSKEGLKALGDAVSEVKDSLRDPGPPPPPAPPPPPPTNQPTGPGQPSTTPLHPPPQGP